MRSIVKTSVVGAALCAAFLLLPPAALPQREEASEPAETEGAPAEGRTEEEAPTEDEPAPETPPGVVHIVLDSIIHPVAAEFVKESLEYADQKQAIALVIELNTPGGLLESTREIFKAMLTARTPVVVFVGPSGARAASAGFFILMASDVAAMAPGTNTGAAHPVAGQGEDIEGDLGKKVEEDAAATIRSLARQHGRNVELAEAAVLESKSYTAQEALEQNLIELTAESVPELLRLIDGRKVQKAGEEEITLATASAQVDQREMRSFQRFLAVLNNPQIAYLLMTLGFLGLYMELSNPGTIFPGVFGAICLILAFYTLSALPINYAGVALLILALMFFIGEIYVVSYGVLTIGGVVALVLGSVMLFKDADPALRIGFEVIIPVAATILVVVLALMSRAIQVRRGKVQTGIEGLVSERGLARTTLDPAGKVFVHGEIWRARSETPVAADAEIEVVAVEGLELKVRPVAAETIST